MTQTGLWFCDYNKKYEGNDPLFYAIEQIDVARYLEQNYTALHNELKVLWQQNREVAKAAFGPYNTFDDKQFPIGSWQKMVFKVWGLSNARNMHQFPVTASLLHKFPNISSCFVTKTAPHSIIKPHCGETNAHLRIHLGLKVPLVDAAVCGMEVGHETIGWQNGKTFAFLDAHEHHVWNHSDTDRYVLIVDLIRPEFANRKKFICVRVIVSQLFFYVASWLKVPHLHRVPQGLLDALAYIGYWPIVFIMWLHNKIGIFKL